MVVLCIPVEVKNLDIFWGGVDTLWDNTLQSLQNVEVGYWNIDAHHHVRVLLKREGFKTLEASLKFFTLD